LRHVCYIRHQSYFPRFDRPNNIWLKNTHFQVSHYVMFSLSSCHLLPLGPSVSLLPRMRQTKFHTHTITVSYILMFTCLDSRGGGRSLGTERRQAFPGVGTRRHQPGWCSTSIRDLQP
jgi:hypothetical protein